MKNFEYAEQGVIQDFLPNTDIVITSGASIINIEIVVMGVPLIRVKPDNNFFLDPLAWSNYFIKPVKNPDEIINAIKLILNMKKEERKRFQTFGKDILSNYFTEINENNMKVFN